MACDVAVKVNDGGDESGLLLSYFSDYSTKGLQKLEMSQWRIILIILSKVVYVG